MFGQDRGRCGGDPEDPSLGERDAQDAVVARIAGRDKAPGQRGAQHPDPQPAMREGLIVIGDRLVLDDGHAELGGELLGRQLP